MEIKPEMCVRPVKCMTSSTSDVGCPSLLGEMFKNESEMFKGKSFEHVSPATKNKSIFPPLLYNLKCSFSL